MCSRRSGNEATLTPGLRVNYIPTGCGSHADTEGLHRRPGHVLRHHLAHSTQLAQLSNQVRGPANATGSWTCVPCFLRSAMDVTVRADLPDENVAARHVRAVRKLLICFWALNVESIAIAELCHRDAFF